MKHLRAVIAVLLIALLPSTALANAPHWDYSLHESADSIFGAFWPHTCLTEDSVRVWYGANSLRGSFTTTVTYCGTGDDPIQPGGEGLAVQGSGRKAVDVVITYPDGHQTHGLRQCVITDVPFIGHIEPGTYTITFIANGNNVGLSVISSMASQAWRDTHCS